MYAGCKNTIGCHNTFIGCGAGAYVTTGRNNVYLGCRAGFCHISGNYNTFFGNRAGFALETGTNNTIIGCGAAASSTSVNNEITLGNSLITTIRAQVTTITALSDARDKCDVTTLNTGMDFLRAVRPVKFAWNMRDGAKIGIKETGFIAQELRAVLDASPIKPWLSDLVISNDDDSRLEASPGKLLPLIIRALQELEDRIAVLEAKQK
jgi:hypothetical protein